MTPFDASGKKPFENTVGKGENAHNEQFLLFPKCFLPVWITFCKVRQVWNCRLQTFSIWKSLKFVVWERVNTSTSSSTLKETIHLTHYQMTNFRLFQTERVCRRKFQIWRKWKKVIQTGRKHCGKKGKLPVTSNFSFSHSVFKRLVSQGRQKGSLCGNGLKRIFWAKGEIILKP